MFKKTVLLVIIFLQLVRLASALASFDVVDFGGTSTNFVSAMALANQGLLVQLNPVKTIVNVSKRMAVPSAPAVPAKNERRQHPLETTIIHSVSPELVKTVTPLCSASGPALLGAIFILMCLVTTRRRGIVLCRIQHLFSRAREGICVIIAAQSYFFKNISANPLQG
jgi:hypothetical protein